MKIFTIQFEKANQNYCYILKNKKELISIHNSDYLAKRGAENISYRSYTQGKRYIKDLCKQTETQVIETKKPNFGYESYDFMLPDFEKTYLMKPMFHCN